MGESLSMKNFPFTVLVTTEEDDTKQTLVDGRFVKNRNYVLYCPNCKRVITTFEGNGLPPEQVYASIRAHNEQLIETHRYCPACGQKLNFNVDYVEPYLYNSDEEK